MLRSLGFSRLSWTLRMSISSDDRELFDRRVLPVVLDRLIDDPVFMVEGPRSVGREVDIVASGG